MTDKVIVTNLSALKAKYGASGVGTIKKAVAGLVAADKKRGLQTSLVALDDAAAMKKLRAAPVTNPASAAQNKKAVDGVYDALAPDFLLILGAVDVVPHQDLRNPLWTGDPADDPDQFAYGDLPYACEAAYSRDVQKFVGPSRIVGRLPDLVGETAPAYLVGLLNTAASWKPLSAKDYASCLGISAEAWKGSTEMSLKKVFGSADGLLTSPKSGPGWAAKLINRRMHFINCHGADTYPNFLGQSATVDTEQPVCHEAAYVSQAGNILEGTVVAAECCYGAQLYDRRADADGLAGLCNAYLGRKAYGFLGSTTVAYGPAEGNDSADLICLFFLQNVLGGASLGRAALAARQKFVRESSPLSPTNFKTLAQFNLYGDPSITPVAAPDSHVAVGPKLPVVKGVAPRAGAAKAGAAGPGASKAGAAKAFETARRVERAERRETLRAEGLHLAATQPVIASASRAASASVRTALRKLARQLNLTSATTISYDVQTARGAAPARPRPTGAVKMGAAKMGAAKAGSKAKAVAPPTTAFHVMFGENTPPPARAGSAAPKAAATAKAGASKKSAGKEAAPRPRVPNRVILEAKEVGGKIVSVKKLHRR